MEEGIIESRLIAILVTMEQESRRNSRRLEGLWRDRIRILTEDILKDKDKKEEKKEEKKTSQLRFQPEALESPNSSLAALAPTGKNGLPCACEFYIHPPTDTPPPVNELPCAREFCIHPHARVDRLLSLNEPSRRDPQVLAKRQRPNFNLGLPKDLC